MSENIGLILLAAGSGKRMEADRNKVFMDIKGKPIFLHAISAFIESGVISEYVLVCKEGEESFLKKHLDSLDITIKIAYGGKERQDSVYSGLMTLSKSLEFVMVHDSARPYISPDTIRDCSKSLDLNGSAVVGVGSHDTVKRVEDGKICETLDRSNLINIQTPQCFRRVTLIKAHKKAQRDGFMGTDESVLVERLGEPVYFVHGKYTNIKITTKADIEKREKNAMKIGHGYDVHAFSKGRKLIIGGVEIPNDRGLLGHSDADVLVHAIIDALLGAAGFPDIGQLFPDTDSQYKDADSLVLLKKIVQLVEEKFHIQNIDCTLVMQAPKVGEYIPKMKKKLINCLNISNDNINIKATTTEKLGFVGREEGVSAHAVCLLLTV